MAGERLVAMVRVTGRGSLRVAVESETQSQWRSARAASWFLALLVVLGGSREANAGEKQFGYVYEPRTLAPGQIELEQWVTPRLGKAGGVFSEIDLRTELEVGVVDDLQASLYLNTVATR